MVTSAATTAGTGPSRRGTPVGPTRPRRHRLRDALLGLVAVAVAAGGVWGLLAPRDTHLHGAAQGGVVDVDSGVLRVDGLADKTIGHAMAGMDMPDEVAPGMRRFAVNVTLAATGDDALAYSRRDFLVSGPGVKPVVPVRGDFEEGSVVAGTALSGSLTFDVPEDATTLILQFQDGRPVALPRLSSVDTGGHGSATTHDHGGGHADGRAQPHGDHAH